MSFAAPSYVNINPSFTLPEVIMPYNQASGAYETVAGGEILTRLSDGDLVVYVNRLDVKTKAKASQGVSNQLPSCEIVFTQSSTPTYLQRSRAQYDHHDIAAASRRGVGLVEAQRLAMRQAHFQNMRNALLYGYNPVRGEGILNAPGVVNVPLPADTFGNDTASTYEKGEMGYFLLNQVQQIKSLTMQGGIGRHITILGPQRILMQFEYSVVQLTDYQSRGAGSTSTAGLTKDVLEMNGDTLVWAYDDTLIGKGAGGTDAVLIVLPEIANPQGGPVNTNEFAKLKPGLAANTLQLADRPAPSEIITPLAGGATDVVSELRVTSGWALRPEGVRVISMAP